MDERVERQKRKKYETYRVNARKRGKTWALTYEQFISICEQYCHYCRVAPLSGGSNRWPHNGVDRKDNKMGYVLDNCLPCCSWCNRAKGTKDYGAFMAYIERVRNG